MSLNIDDLSHLLRAGESERVEFKDTRGRFRPETVLKDAAAIANYGGGMIVLGVTGVPDHAVVGIGASVAPDRLMATIEAELDLPVSAAVVDHPDGRVIVLAIPPASFPVEYDGHYWLRKNAVTIPADERTVWHSLKRGFRNLSEEYPRRSSVFISRIAVQNYRSISDCDVTLEPLTFLVGPNGSGKSNFLDVLHFVADALNTSVDDAVRKRGGFRAICRRSAGRAARLTIRLDAIVAEDVTATYRIELVPTRGGHRVQTEECEVSVPGLSRSFALSRNRIQHIDAQLRAIPIPGQLYLAVSRVIPPFHMLSSRLSGMAFYRLNPQAIRDLQAPDQREVLDEAGDNLASIILNLEKLDLDSKERLEAYLAQIVPGLEGVSFKTLGPLDTLEFRQRESANSKPVRFLAGSMSDGTLLAAGVLAALFQPGGSWLPLIGIEEPEMGLHPAAVGVLLDALRDASERRQILVTSHSPDLLDNKEIGETAIRAVVLHGGATLIGRLDQVGQSVLRDHLYTAGELMRMDQLTPDIQSVDISELSP